jgi:hypothetical protein
MSTKRVLIPGLLAIAAACATPDVSQRVDATGLPSGDAFVPVANMLVFRCGSLDCHGSSYRNLRLNGLYSHRLLNGDPSNPPRPNGDDTTTQEYQADYDAVVSLEPEVIKQVVADKGQNPERLTFFRKGRGDEAHKGGRRIFDGDDADTCLRSWFEGQVDQTACGNAASDPPESYPFPDLAGATPPSPADAGTD